MEEKLQDPYTDDKTGFTYPGVNKIIDSVKDTELSAFIDASILLNTDAYTVDTKNHLVYTNDF